MDDRNVIKHVFGNAGVYLGFKAGKPTFDISKIVHSDLSIPIETALHQAKKNKREVMYGQITISTEGGEKYIHLQVKPIVSKKLSENLYVIFFIEQENEKRPEQIQSFDSDAVTAERINDLEQELKYTKENLQATIEELETSNEELQATNEELLASNQELQSTNEELQSVNEELYTVNAQYQVKIQELMDLNDDMDNLLRSTTIGTLFLDEELQIRKFTPEVTKYIHIRETDIGRPIRHFSYNLDYDTFLKDLETVLTKPTAIETEVKRDDNVTLLVRITPYQTKESFGNAGVVVTFIDISNLKSLQRQLKASEDKYQKLVDDHPEVDGDDDP